MHGPVGKSVRPNTPVVNVPLLVKLIEPETVSTKQKKKEEAN